MKYKQEALLLDPTLKAAEEPWQWPQTPPGRMGKRWVIRNRSGEVIAYGDVGNPNSAWRHAWAEMVRRKA